MGRSAPGRRFRRRSRSLNSGGTASGTCTVTVRFAPASTATGTATMTAASVNPAVTATDVLTGTGVAHPPFLYWTDQFGTDQGTIKEAPLTGGPATTLVTGQISPVGVAVSQ